MENTITACGKCGGSLNESMRFCPACGRRVSARSAESQIKLLGAGVAVFLVGFILMEVMREDRTMSASSKGAHVGQEVDDPQIKRMREELEKDPQDVVKLRLFAGILGDKLRNNPSAPPALVFEAIDVLGKILAIDANDPGALVMMADLSFDQRAFTKALDFYERYLKIDPDDLGARSRYASTLTFLGRFDDSIAELSKVLKTDPKNFPAMAYMAITYAQRGDIPKAKELSQSALALAPSEDARARFSAFVSSLDSAAESDAGVVPASAKGSSPAPAKAAEVSQAPGATKGVAGFIQVVKSNPVAGPKFVRYEEPAGGTLKLFFADFPMKQMPPFAKEKFFNGLKASIQSSGLTDLKTLAFIDHATGAQMETLSLK